MAAEEVPFLKEKFYQVDKSRSHRGESGIGVGLSIVDKIVDLHEGIFSIDSDVDRGFCVRIQLPRKIAG